MVTYAAQCFWGRGSTQALLDGNSKSKLILCTEWTDKSGKQEWKSPNELQLVASEDFFATSRVVSFDESQRTGIVGFGLLNKYMIAALKRKVDGDLDMYVSLDAVTFTNVKFPLGSGLKENVCVGVGFFKSFASGLHGA